MRNVKVWQIAMVCGVLIAGSGPMWADPAAPEGDAPPPPPREMGDRPHRGERGPGEPGRRDGERGGPEDREARREAMRQRMFEQMFRDIELTPEQREQVKAALDKGHETRRAWMEEHRDELRDARQAMREAKQANDEAKLDAAKAQIRTLFESAPKPEAAFEDVRALLTDEQKEAFGRNLEEMRQRFRERGGPRHDGRGGPHGPGGPPEGRGRHGPPPADGERPPRDGEKLDI